ncbi:MAG: Gfo/Idh/MocA family oxidoreductase [Clostridia bacterium]|nr:Gfo/Idh/MocA family oxidoreductase [Clostridia bacterium]
MKKIRMAQLGTGHPHARGQTDTILQIPEIDLIGFAEPAPEYRHPESRYFLDPSTPYSKMHRYTVEELLAMDDLDAVAIECQEEIGTEYAQMFAEKGVHIFMDKPGTHGTASFAALMETAKQKNIVLEMGYMYRYNPLVQKALELTRAGELGEIYAVEGQMSLYYPESMCGWIGKHKGGMMYYLGCHMVDLVLLFMGGVPEKVIPMNCCTGQYGFTGENYGFAALQYKNGVSFVKTTCAEHNGFQRRQLVISGTKGTIEIRPMEMPGQGPIYGQKSAAIFSVQGKTEQIACEPFGRYDRMLRSFADHVNGKTVNPFTYAYELDLFRTVMQCCGWED